MISVVYKKPIYKQINNQYYVTIVRTFLYLLNLQFSKRPNSTKK